MVGIIQPPNEGKDYTWYISGIYCQLGYYMLPTTPYKNLSWNVGVFVTLPETYSKFAPENGWLEDDRFLLGAISAYFQGFCCLVLWSADSKNYGRIAKGTHKKCNFLTTRNKAC